MISKPRSALAVFLLMAVGAYAADLTSNDLIEGGKRYDGKEVAYTGEAIGDAMRRGDHFWVNVNDGNNAIGVWLEADQFASIGEYGSYKAKGDVLRIQGFFHRSCREHGGDMDLHAASVAVVKRGEAVRYPINPVSIVLAIVFLPGSLALFLLWKKKEKL